MLSPDTPALKLSIFGIPVRVEFTFFILLALLVYQFNAMEAGLLCFAIFISLVAHESGHAFTAKALGCRDISISLWMGGGLARHSQTTRGRSLAITLAGPAVGLGLAAFAFGATRLGLKFNDGANLLIGWLISINIFWNIFNMIPIHPMDGGQALFYTLSFWMGDNRAMIWVSRISMVLCVIVGYFAWQLEFQFAALFCLFFFMTNMRIHAALRDL